MKQHGMALHACIGFRNPPQLPKVIAIRYMLYERIRVKRTKQYSIDIDEDFHHLGPSKTYSNERCLKVRFITHLDCVAVVREIQRPVRQTRMSGIWQLLYIGWFRISVQRSASAWEDWKCQWTNEHNIMTRNAPLYFRVYLRFYKTWNKKLKNFSTFVTHSRVLYLKWRLRL